MPGIGSDKMRCVPCAAVALLASMAWLAGCAAHDDRAATKGSWAAEVLYPEGSSGKGFSPGAFPGNENQERGYNLYILTQAIGLDFASPQQFLRTLHRPPQNAKDAQVVGHSWIILQSPTQLLECGHTGEFGISQPTYYQDVLRRIHDGDPNPISYLWETMQDGQFHAGPGSHKPSFVFRLPITPEQYKAIHSYIDSYDYKPFALTGHACADFAAGASKLAGLRLAYQVRLAVPSEMAYEGRTVRLWSDPQFRTLTVGSPDVMESYLRRLARDGIGQDATKWYFQ